MSHVPTVLKSDRSVFDKMLPVDDDGCIFKHMYRIKLQNDKSAVCYFLQLQIYCSDSFRAQQKQGAHS